MVGTVGAATVTTVGSGLVNFAKFGTEILTSLHLVPVGFDSFEGIKLSKLEACLASMVC